MNILEADRDVLPIWVSAAEAAKLPELSTADTKSRQGELFGSTPNILAEFEKTSTVGVAIELLNSAVIEGESQIAIRAAEFLLSAKGLPLTINTLVRDTLGLEAQTHEAVHTNAIAKLRARIKSGRDDPLAWVDLSREYAILGEKERSQRCMLVAIQLCSEHRWISRVAARSFVHFGEPDRAHDLLVRNPNIKSDPWLVATEMAVSRKAGKATKLWGQAKRFLDSNIKPIHISELASSVATNELISGADKKAKGFFKQSLIDPNQNALAQAKWAERNSSLKKLVQVPMHTDIAAYEAQYWEAYSDKEILAALAFAKSWFEAEPFSSGPPLAISYLAALLDDYELITSASEKGLVANPSNATIRLNRIFAWLATTDFTLPSSENRDKAELYMRELRSILNGDEWSEAAHAMANIGMFFYRTGNPEEGRLRYQAAENLFERNAPSARIMLVVNHLREALIANTPWALDILKSAHRLLTNPKSSATPGAEFYLEKIALLEKLPGEWKDKFISNHTLSPIHEELDNKYRKPPIIQPSRSIETTFWLPSEFGSIESLKSFTTNPESAKSQHRKN